tara:strand:- start:450 stop:1604 length:1155 start_codon:yes stop_codon:yes gene_type:complete
MSKSIVGDKIFTKADHLGQETSLKVKGLVREDKRAPGGFEIDITRFEIIHNSNNYPITPKEHGVEYLLDRRHLWIRSERQTSILKIRHEIINSTREFFNDRDFILVDTPILTPAACEGTSTLFPVQYFDDNTAFLSQSGQLYNEANAMALGKVYCFGPTFRAEKSKTRRHLNEFWMVEPEMAYATLDDVIDLSEQLVLKVVQNVLSKNQKELRLLKRDTSMLEKLQNPFPRISYDEAADILKTQGLSFEWGKDFGSPDETALANHFDQPVFVHKFPKAIKAFYMKSDAERPDLSLSVDLLAPEGYGEIIGGGQREDDLEILESQIKTSDLPEESFQWYLDLRRYGSVPHGGFGMGIERVVSWICGLDHVRESIPYPRMLHRLKP